MCQNLGNGSYLGEDNAMGMDIDMDMVHQSANRPHARIHDLKRYFIAHEHAHVFSARRDRVVASMVAHHTHRSSGTTSPA